MTRPRPIRCSLALVLMIQAIPASAQMLFDADADGPLPVLEDTAGPYSVDDAKVIGEIPAGTLGLTPIGETFTLEDGRTFISLRFQGRQGWVDSARLKRRWAVDWGVERLNCGGTEPFWGLDIAGKDANLWINEKSFKLSLQRLRSGANRRDVREVVWNNGTEEWIGFIADRPMCSDGMSDFHYPLEIFIGDGDSEVATGPLIGCCSFVPE